MKNILITGGLGYIGSQLATLYLHNKNVKITVIDKIADPKRIKILNSGGIEYKNIDILDVEKITPLVKDADVVFHLAGVTSVPRIKNEESNSLNNEIVTTAITGTKNIIENIKDTSRIIFPSTHVVFEGLKDIQLDIEEDYEVCPNLTYAESKVQNEIDISTNCSNYIILRLGSVHGLNTLITRYNIMVNFFAKAAANKGSINLHGGGVQLKSLVSIHDVVRCLKFFESDGKISQEIFHCVSENISVKEVADLCKRHSEELEINFTQDEIPNPGYSLSSDKLKKIGFKFEKNVEDSVKDIIHNEGN